MKVNGSFIGLTLIMACIAGVVTWASNDGEVTKARVAQSEADLKDPSKPPVLSKTMRDPTWSIKGWLSIGTKDGDCVFADEIMDEGGNVKILKKGGAETRRYYLADYIDSCERRQHLEFAAPAAEKWCAFRSTDDRLDQLCSEWMNNKDQYVREIQRTDAPTLERYRTYPGK